ncbi:hypothetical protein H4217_009488 [Coemansia sp. RSA 1939]|nr:hypothetical protein H4217_009488 [Coemansia sp. RSA 1939]
MMQWNYKIEEEGGVAAAHSEIYIVHAQNNAFAAIDVRGIGKPEDIEQILAQLCTGEQASSNTLQTLRSRATVCQIKI